MVLMEAVESSIQIAKRLYNGERRSENMIETIYRHHPELRGEAARAIAHGWANQVWIVGERLVFRFPRTAEGKQELRREQLLLPDLARSLPVQVPQFLYQSPLDEEITYVGYQQIPGTPLTPARFQKLDRAKKLKFSVTLASFLTTLHTHRPQISLPTVGKESWEAFYQEIEQKAFSRLNRAERDWTKRSFESFLTDSRNFCYAPRLLHGDFSADHLLHQAGELSGVIDFGDVRLGDPAYDFVGLYAAYGAEFTQEVVKRYGLPQDDLFWQRVTGFYVQRLPFHAILSGLDTGNEERVQIGLQQLREGVDRR